MRNDEQDEEVQLLIKELECLQLRIGAVHNRLHNLERNKKSQPKEERQSNQGQATGGTGKHKCTFMIGERIRI